VFAGGFALLLLFPVTYVLGQRDQRPRLVLMALDTDHDGQLSAAEIANASASLRSLDRNGDGEITFDELEPSRTDAGASPDQLVAMLMAFDKNSDGVLTLDEVPERMQPMFQRGDANHDGKLTSDEIRQMAGHTGSPNGRRGGTGSAQGNFRLDPLLNALDTNHDGVISADEIAAASENLAKLDANHDGILEAQEIRPRQQTPAERVAHVLGEFDTNGDGKLSREEVPDGMRARFDASDTNHDGFLDKEELQQMYAEQPQNGAAPGSQPAGTQQKGQHD
jgi:Ca2+-binding EF-hand superfamily protein